MPSAVGKPLPSCAGSLSFHKLRSSGAVKPDLPGKLVQVMEYDMCEFLPQCVDKCKKLAGPYAAKLPKVTTPFCSDASLDALRDIPGEGV